MITACARTGGAFKTGLTPDEVRAALNDPRSLVWVDIDADGRDEAEPLLRDIFRFHPLTIDDCFNTLIDPPKVDDYGVYLFVIIHAVHYNPQTRDLWTAELDMYVGKNYVVSVHWSSLHAVDDVRRRAESNGLVFSRGADFLAHALFDVAVDDFHPVVEALDDETANIEETVLRRPERDVLQGLLALKRNAQRLKRSILPQRDVANRFARGEYEHLVGGEALMYFRDVYDHTVRVEEMIDSVRDLTDSALNTYLSSVNNRINEVMKALAIVAVVFLPLTLIASIYGTNFDKVFPPYGWRWGFAGMMVTFIAIVGALWAWFRWRRWI